MTNALSGELRLNGKAAAYVGRWTLAGEILEWHLNGKEYRIESGADLSRSIESFLKILGKREFGDRLELHACLTCKKFVMSEMAREMGRGQRGMCELHKIGVEVCFLCSDYEKN